MSMHTIAKTQFRWLVLPGCSHVVYEHDDGHTLRVLTRKAKGQTMTDLEKQHTMESFWTMIRNDPKNDANRLVFGDWCEEHGEMELAADLRGGSEKWLREFAPNFDVDYAELMEIASNYLEYGDYVVEYDSERWRNHFYAHDAEFWQHYKVMTGIENEDKGSPFSCSC